MATQGLNALQVSYAKSWSGLSTENHLYAIYQNEPQLASDIVTEIFNQRGYVGMDNFLSKYPTQVLDHDGEFRWMLKGDDRRAIRIVSFTSSAYTNVSKAGLNQEIFQLELEENFFQVSDYLIFDDREFGVRIVAEGWANGSNWVYEVQTMNGAAGAFIPSQLLQAGKRVSRQNNIVTNTLNDEYSKPSFASHFEMRNIFSTLSKEQIVPGNMHDRPLLIKMNVGDGKPVTVWTKWQDIVTEMQWRREKASQLMFSQFNQKSDGTFANKARNGFVIKQGAGLRQQISPSYKFYYTTLTLDYLHEVAQNLSINILPEDQREFLILTGERGMYLFSKLIEDKVAVFNPMGNPDRLIGSGSNLGFRGQYKVFEGYNGIKFTVMHMPEYDDVIDNRLPHPDGGYTENYRMTIMNIGTTNGEPNIQKMAARGRSDIKWYVAGSTTPFGAQKNALGSSEIDGYKIMYQTTQAIKLKNPLSAAELIPNVSY